MSSSSSKNPLLVRTGIPPFGEITAQDVEPGISEILAQAEQLLTSAESLEVADWDSLMQLLERIDLLFEYGWGPIGHLLSVANSDELRQAHEKVLPRVVQFQLRWGQSLPIYQRMCRLRDSCEWEALSGARRRIVSQAIQNSELSGIGLMGCQQQQFNENQKRLSQLASDFSNHVLDATKAFYLDITEADDARGMPASLLRRAAATWNDAHSDSPTKANPENGPWRITLDAPSFGPFMEHCQNRELRKVVYRAYTTRASSGEFDNTPLILEILRLRKQQALLLGFDHYAAKSLSQKMAGDQTRVDDILNQLLDASLVKGRVELDEITALAQQSGHTGPLAHWDIAFQAERLREKRYSFTDEELRPYFSLDRVLNGLFALCRRLFGITVRREDGKAPVWHADVRYYEVDNESGQHIAGFYLDPYSRPENKRPGAWMNHCIVRSVTSEHTRLPVAHLICNGTPPVGDIPSLMTFREVETLFHEFGHGLQHMLTTVDERDASGINGIEWDAVELPSQFMENWCYHRPTLLGMAVHHQTGEVLPDDLFQKICAARTYRAASGTLRQLLFGMTDMELHSTFDPEGEETPFDVFLRISQATSPMPPDPENRFLCAFSHIFAGGYAAGYYSYKWAEVLSADAFSAFEEAGLDDEATVASIGRRFRDTILAEGGSRHPMEIFRDFRGREPGADALLRHLGLG